MHVINLSGYLAASVQIKPVEPVKHKSILRPNVMLHYSKLNTVISSHAKLAASCFFFVDDVALDKSVTACKSLRKISKK